LLPNSFGLQLQDVIARYTARRSDGFGFGFGFAAHRRFWRSAWRNRQLSSVAELGWGSAD
jgi:hypothetical protein